MPDELEPRGWVKWMMGTMGGLLVIFFTAWINHVAAQQDKMQSGQEQDRKQVNDVAQRMIRVETKLEGVELQLQDVGRTQEKNGEKLDRVLESLRVR